jgi:hypothetical protein
LYTSFWGFDEHNGNPRSAILGLFGLRQVV